MNYLYTSRLGKYIEQMVRQKHALGFPYIESGRVLYEFDRYCTMFFPDKETITPELANAWAVIRPTEKPRSFQNRMAPVRELARYMNRAGMDAYVIPSQLAPKDSQRYMPHIFTPGELDLFFRAADSQPFMCRARLRHLQLPVLFRLMYCCGLRPHEARLIQCGHLNLKERTLFIPESKGHKDRIIVMPPEMARICSAYYPYLKREFPDSKFFFPCQRFGGQAYKGSWLIKNFRQCWDEAGIGIPAGNAPRPYDFRHTFATYRLYQWMKEKKDLSAYLPYLSAYMGHADFSKTAYYIHLVPEYFSELSGMDLNAYGSLIPEVPYETER